MKIHQLLKLIITNETPPLLSRLNIYSRICWTDLLSFVVALLAINQISISIT